MRRQLMKNDVHARSADRIIRSANMPSEAMEWLEPLIVQLQATLLCARALERNTETGFGQHRFVIAKHLKATNVLRDAIEVPRRISFGR